MDINITPFSESNFLAILNRLSINDNHLEWR